MVTYRSPLQWTVADPPVDEQLNDLRVAWVMGYRRSHPEADRWAEGFWTIEHGVETQGRVFRMVEQLAIRGIDPVAAFAALRRADARVDAAALGLLQGDWQARHLYFEGRAIGWEDLRQSPWSAILAAADAGCAVIDRLICEHGTVVSLLRPEAFEERLGRAGRRWFPQAQAGRVMIVIDEATRLDHLRAYGFDPIAFDGADPAGFAWAVFVLACRGEATLTELRCDCHPRFTPVPLGIAADRMARSLKSPRRLTAVRATG